MGFTHIFLCCLMLAVVKSAADDSFHILPPNGTLVYLENHFFSLTCVTKNTKLRLTWKMNGTDITTNLNYTITRENDDGLIKVKLQKKLTIRDSGDYQCFDAKNFNLKSVSVRVFRVKVVNGTVSSGKPVFIRCETEHLENYRFNWTKDHVNVAEVDGLATRYTEHANHTLEIRIAKRRDAGQYQCVYEVGDKFFKKSIFVNVSMNLAPYIESTEKSRNLVQGDKLQLECKIQSFPYATVVWKKENETFERTQRIHWDDRTLTIYDLQFEDRGKYTCIATNMINSTSMTVLVRVKDKLAALWPFLGIVAEVVILCIIIFICEKKRSKDMEDEYDSAGQQSMPNAKDHKGKDEIRQRNVRT